MRFENVSVLCWENEGQLIVSSFMSICELFHNINIIFGCEHKKLLGFLALGQVVVNVVVKLGYVIFPESVRWH